jgi:hypothetical protein
VSATHPPIPPNCEDILEEFQGEWCFREGKDNLEPLRFMQRDSSSPLNRRRWKELIARCRCAWSDAAEEIKTACYQSGLPGGMVEEMLEHNPDTFGGAGKAMEIALKNADAWAEWGKSA